MPARPHSLRIAVVFAGLVSLVASGCALNVDLATSPHSVQVGEPVTFDVSVTNQTTCPVGLPTALIFPFIPKDALIENIRDDKLRGFLSDAVDEFCTDGDFRIPDGAEASCNFEGGDLVCTVRGLGDEIPLASEANIPVSATGVEEVTCDTDGGTITCRVPQALVAMAEEGNGEEPQEGIFDELLCLPAGPIGVCTGLGLAPGGSATGQLELIAQVPPGVYRNWIIAFPEVRGGVCKLIKNIPCDPSDSKCGPCGTGICTSGKTAIGTSKVGNGCDTNGECGTQDTPTCSQCTLVPDGDFIPGLECTTTNVGLLAKAPAMSPWGLLVTALALLGVAGAALRRLGRKGRV